MRSWKTRVEACFIKLQFLRKNKFWAHLSFFQLEYRRNIGSSASWCILAANVWTGGTNKGDRLKRCVWANEAIDILKYITALRAEHPRKLIPPLLDIISLFSRGRKRKELKRKGINTPPHPHPHTHTYIWTLTTTYSKANDSSNKPILPDIWHGRAGLFTFVRYILAINFQRLLHLNPFYTTQSRYQDGDGTDYMCPSIYSRWDIKSDKRSVRDEHRTFFKYLHSYFQGNKDYYENVTKI